MSRQDESLDESLKSLLAKFDVSELKQENVILMGRRGTGKQQIQNDFTIEMIARQLQAGKPPNVKYYGNGGRRATRHKEHLHEDIKTSPLLAGYDEEAKAALVNEVFSNQ